MAEPDAEATLADRAERRYGLFTLEHAVAAGMNRTTLYRRARRGRYALLHPGVFGFAGQPESWERSLLAGCLAAGGDAVASHRSAARLWGLTDTSDDIVEITVPANQRPRLQKVVLHRSADLDPSHTTVRRRIPVTNPLRTMVDLGTVLCAEGVEDALDAGIAWPSLFSVAAVRAMLDQLAGNGRRGSGVLRQVLDERVLGDAVSDSKLERRMGALLKRAGLPPAVFHHVVCTPGGVFLAEVDFAYPELKLVIEVDGFDAHGTPRAMAKDFVRQNGLVPYGWHVLRFTWRQVTRQPEMVAQAIRAALAGLQAA